MLEGGNNIVRMGDIINKVWDVVICECRYKSWIAQVPVWCRCLAYLPLTQDTRVRVPVRKAYFLCFCLLLWFVCAEAFVAYFYIFIIKVNIFIISSNMSLHICYGMGYNQHYHTHLYGTIRSEWVIPSKQDFIVWI